MPAEATTAAAIAPSTSGASTSRIEPLPLTLLLEHRAGGQDRAAEVAEHDRPVALVGGGDGGAHEAPSVPSPPSGSPPAASMRTSGPAICAASAAVPEAISRLCDTMTMPTTRPV